MDSFGESLFSTLLTSPTNQNFQDRLNEESSLVRKGAQIVTSNEDMQIRIYNGSNTSTQMQTSQHFHNEEVKRVENRLSPKESNQDGYVNQIGCVNTFEEGEKDLYSVMSVLYKCQTVVNCSTGELIQIEEKHE